MDNESACPTELGIMRYSMDVGFAIDLIKYDSYELSELVENHMFELQIFSKLFLEMESI